MRPKASQEPYAYARLKIHDPERGYVLLGTTVFGWHFKGGDGVSEIPDWHAVNRKQAQALKDVRQTDGPSAPRAFDIASPELKVQIERAEELERRFRLGLIPRPVVAGTPQGLVKGRLGAPPMPPKLEDLKDDDEDAVPFLPSEFMPPTVMGEVPIESSHSHAEISSIAPPEALQAARKQGSIEALAAGQASSIDSLPPAARAQIESLQRQILQLSGQLESIYHGPKAAKLYTDPADGEDSPPAKPSAITRRKKHSEAPTSQQNEDSTSVSPRSLQGRKQALQGLQTAPVAPTEEEEQAPPQAPPHAPSALRAPTRPPAAKLPKAKSKSKGKSKTGTKVKVEVGTQALKAKIAPNPADDPVNLVDTDDPEEAAVFHKGQDLTQEFEDDDVPSVAELGIEVGSDSDAPDPDLEIVLAQAEKEKAAEAKKTAKKATWDAMWNTAAKTRKDANGTVPKKTF